MAILAKEKSLHSVFYAIEMEVDSQEPSNSEQLQVDTEGKSEEIAQAGNLDGIIAKLRDNICKR